MTDPGSRLLATAIVLALLAAPALGAAAQQSGVAFGTTQVEVDDILLTVDVRADGSAHWTVEHRSLLDSDERREAFEAQAQDVAEDPASYTDPLATQLGDVAAAAAESTGREMAIRNVSVAAETRQLPQEYGVVVYRFEWDGFAAVEDGELRAGPVLAGMFLDEESRLRLRWPDGYRLLDTRPTPDEERERYVTWFGPADFGADEPQVVLTTAAPAPVGGLPGWALAGLALAIGSLAVGAWVRVRGVPGRAVPTDGAESDAPGGPLGAGVDDADAPGPPADEALLSNEEQVRRFLEARDGRARQQEIAESLDWSATKTSEVLGDLHEAGAIERFRLGRENVVSLPEDDDI